MLADEPSCHTVAIVDHRPERPIRRNASINPKTGLQTCPVASDRSACEVTRDPMEGRAAGEHVAALLPVGALGRPVFRRQALSMPRWRRFSACGSGPLDTVRTMGFARGPGNWRHLQLRDGQSRPIGGLGDGEIELAFRIKSTCNIRQPRGALCARIAPRAATPAGSICALPMPASRDELKARRRGPPRHLRLHQAPQPASETTGRSPRRPVARPRRLAIRWSTPTGDRRPALYLDSRRRSESRD